MKKPRPILIMTVGLPASGKSTYLDTQRAKLPVSWQDVVLVSTDAVRMELYGDESDQTDPEKVFFAFHETIDTYLREGRIVYADATHIRSEWRSDLIAIAKRRRAKVKAFVFKVPLWKLVLRDRNRLRHVGIKVLFRMWWNFEMPTTDEGFDEITIIKG